MVYVQYIVLFRILSYLYTASLWKASQFSYYQHSYILSTCTLPSITKSKPLSYPALLTGDSSDLVCTKQEALAFILINPWLFSHGSILIQLRAAHTVGSRVSEEGRIYTGSL